MCPGTESGHWNLNSLLRLIYVCCCIVDQILCQTYLAFFYFLEKTARKRLGGQIGAFWYLFSNYLRFQIN
ncbi:hypothetical protein BpHYR1_003967 [Brachionus plicatilis]|uniref:Uncharacterized protein n=1 Tax=Brachionus plicatilis TaxID=10195 RepID=A0A3M7RXG8_BRAPC|nr:hypothetical protein BpHYR1_003967 [Brachionus plicatilis]